MDIRDYLRNRLWTRERDKYRVEWWEDPLSPGDCHVLEDAVAIQASRDAARLDAVTAELEAAKTECDELRDSLENAGKLLESSDRQVLKQIERVGELMNENAGLCSKAARLEAEKQQLESAFDAIGAALGPVELDAVSLVMTPTERALAAIEQLKQTPCPHIVQSSSGSAYCRLAESGKPVDMLLFCPHCGEQHVDEAKPDVCEACGHESKWHFEGDNLPSGRTGCAHPECTYETFTAWLNPPHKSHRCTSCNHVWRPADVPTNGVLTLQTSGSRDGNPRPRYFYTAKDYEDAVADSIADLRQRLADRERNSAEFIQGASRMREDLEQVAESNARLVAELATMREAMKFYADPSNLQEFAFMDGVPEHDNDWPAIRDSISDKAKAALTGGDRVNPPRLKRRGFID
jgi:HPt (histidine-containing phosphotransfer) domain-containing protein